MKAFDAEYWPRRYAEIEARRQYRDIPARLDQWQREKALDELTAELAQIDRERAALCEVATLCMNTRAIMPEFREISDYTEVVDIIGAFLERLATLPGLIEEYAVACRLHELAQIHDVQARFTAGFRQPTSGHATAHARLERCRELLAKINAILGVAE